MESVIRMTISSCKSEIISFHLVASVVVGFICIVSVGIA